MKPIVSIIMGSTSDLPVMEKAAKLFNDFEIPFEMQALSAHRTPEEVEKFAKSARDRGIEVISIAADHDKTIYENTASRFPWKNKLCNFKGFEGENFKNYGIIGTPTFYLIDNKGIIQGKYATLADGLSSLPDVR